MRGEASTKRLRHAAQAEALAAEPVSSVDESDSDSSEDDSEAPGNESPAARRLCQLGMLLLCFIHKLVVKHTLSA